MSRPVRVDLWLPRPELISASREQGKANVGLCSSRSEQGTEPCSPELCSLKELGSNLSFGINVKMVVSSFRVEIRRAKSQQRRDYGRWSHSMVLQRKSL